MIFDNIVTILVTLMLVGGFWLGNMPIICQFFEKKPKGDSNIVRNMTIALSALIGALHIAFYVFDAHYTVTPYRISITVFVTLIPICIGVIMEAFDDLKRQQLDQMAEEFLARHQNQNNRKIQNPIREERGINGKHSNDL